MKLCLVIAIALISQAPNTGRGAGNGQPSKAVGGTNQPHSAVDQRGTRALPVVVQVLDSAERQREARERAEDRKDKAATDWWTLFIAGGVLLIAVVQAGLFLWQLRYMRDSLKDTKTAADAALKAATATEASVELAKDTARRQLRAYVTFRRMNIGPIYAGERVSAWNFLPEFRNDGMTPARDLDLRAKWELRPTQLPADFDFATKEEPGVTGMGPRQTLWTEPFALTRDQLAEIRARKSFVYVWGEAHYHDVFPGTEQRHTYFAGEFVVGDLDSRNPKKAVGFHFLPRRNEST